MIGTRPGSSFQPQLRTLPLSGRRDLDPAAFAERRVEEGDVCRCGGRVNLRSVPPRSDPKGHPTERGRYHLPRRDLQAGRLRQHHDPTRKRVFRVGIAVGLEAEACDKILHIGRTAILHDLRVGRLRRDARILQRPQHEDEIVLRELQGEEVLTDQYVARGPYAPERIADGSWMAPAPGRGPRWRRHLQHQPLAGLVPGEEALGVSPRFRAVAVTVRAVELRITVELIVPDDVVEAALIDLTERGPHGIVRRPAGAAASLLESWIFTAGVHKLLAKASCIGLQDRKSTRLNSSH